MSASIYADRARAAKVARILASIPCGKSTLEIAGVANWLAAMTVEERNRFAAKAGRKPPSDTTWELVVTQARARKTLDQAVDDAKRSA